MPFTILRVSAASVLLLAVGTAVVPRVTSRISTSAVVNAPLVSVAAPFDGAITAPSASVATPVFPGDTLFALTDERSENVVLRALRSELSGVAGEISGMEMQSTRLTMLREQLERRRQVQVAARLDWFVTRLREAQADVDSTRARIERDEAVVDRLTRLAVRGNVAERDLMDARADLAEARARHQQAIASRERLETERDYLASDDFVDLASDELERIDYRLDEIAVRSADLDARLMSLHTRRSGLQGEILGLEIEKNRNENFRPKASTSGVIWEASGPAKTTVANGEQVVQILDCRRRFLEVILPERHFESISPGDRVTVLLKGATESFQAKVAAVYGSGARPNRNMQAAQPRLMSNDGLRVIVGIGAAEVGDEDVARSFCDVGRSAEVRFGLKSINPAHYVAKLFRDWNGYVEDIAAVRTDGAATSTN
ncbi:HlyD family efflux transporter periplasmic adaptor subunit [Pseudooceanicola sp. LIPI14-2-Ac024]|uniref:HlyD family efflux transporter periplasmic adaptor subunit n=1 Tax=Pseudooceanicola sp. LIPI14-2-Ac024 TaxID=3344875 RepID=UPI0035CE8A88